MPVQLLFGCAAYAINYFVGMYVSSLLAITTAAFAIGLMGRLYVCIGFGSPHTHIVPAALMMIPTGLGARNNLLAGVLKPVFNTNDIGVTIQDSLTVAIETMKIVLGLSVGFILSFLY